jgi:hypothetical protein
MDEPPVIKLPLSCYENMVTELAWRDMEIFELFLDIYNDLTHLKTQLENDNFSEPTTTFDPLRTFGKYHR